MSQALPFDSSTPFQPGQRLVCQGCGSEIEIRQETRCDPPNQVFRCCGEDMVPSEGTPRRLEGE